MEKLGGHTALFLACSKGLCQIVRILADDPRVDVNKKDRQGWTPLMVCCQFNFIDCARVLIASGRIKDLDYNFLTADGELASMVSYQNQSIYNLMESFRENRDKTIGELRTIVVWGG